MLLDKVIRGARPHSIGTRLTAWGAGITLAICALTCGLLYAGVSYSLRLQVDRFLAGEAREFEAILAEHPGDYEKAQQAVRLELGSRPRRDLGFRLVDERGGVLLTSDPEDPFPAPWVFPAEWNTNGEPAHYETVSPRPGQYPVRVCSLPARTGKGEPVILQATYSLEDVTESLALFRKIAAGSLIVAALASIVGGRILASRSLRPVADMTVKARQIGGASLTDRLPRSGTGDEFDRLADTLNEMLERLQRYTQRLQQFTADASHELRSPLAALKGNAEVTLGRPRSEGELRHAIQESIEQYDRLTRIAEDLLLLARADAGELSLEYGTVRLDSAISAVIAMYSPLAEDRNIELEFTSPAPVRVEADDARVRQLVGNLVDNALKYSGPGKRVLVSAAIENGAARIVVADNGSGIPPDHLSAVFDRFHRVGRSRSVRTSGGAGLGLSIARSIVEAHGGTIDMTSVPGEGTRVTARIPLGPEAGERQGARRALRHLPGC